MEYNREDIEELLYEKLAGTISQEDDLIAEQAIELDAEISKLWLDLNLKMNKPEGKAFISELNTDKTWTAVEERIGTQKVRFHTRKWAYISTAAVFLLAIPMVWIFTFKESSRQEATILASKDVYLVPDKGKAIDLSYNRTVQIGGTKIKSTPKELAYTAGKNEGWATLQVPAAKDYKITLPDGTKVWMNAASSLRFPFQFTKQVREVYLTGEAYFEVAKAKEQSFIVHTEYADIQVHGTSFNVNAYDKPNFAASLVEGAVSASSGTQLLKLKPGQEVRLNKQLLNVDKFDAQEVLSWRRGVYFFHNKSLADISMVLRRWYDVKVIWKRAEVGEQTFTGEIDKTLPIEVIISNLQLSSDIKAEINDGILTFH
ncbi:MAG: FecR family protein [Pedobacter sp.]|nr:MAG: FecR family protein [Pedobacter sp.]